MKLSDRMADSLPDIFNHQIRKDGFVNINGHEIANEDVIKKLGPLLTAERKSRIEHVLIDRTFDITTVAEHLYDIGNISAVMRSAESYGFMPFHILEKKGSRYKKSDRISKGTEKWLDIERRELLNDEITTLKSRGFKIYATSLNASHVIEEIDFTQKSAVVFGNEKDGVSPEMIEHADGTFMIPMYGFAQSFNISVAAAITFSHIHRIRKTKLGASGNLTLLEKTAVMAHYYLRSVESPERHFTG